MNKNVQTFLGCDAEYRDATVALFGAPFDGTTSFRPGARFGPSAIRNESFGIETYSPYCGRDLLDKKVFDAETST
jgi:agmatinase